MFSARAPDVLAILAALIEAAGHRWTTYSEALLDEVLADLTRGGDGMTIRNRLVVTSQQRDETLEQEMRHPRNPKVQVFTKSLSSAVGLSRLGAHVVRLPPGAEANEYHTHHEEEEEFYHVLSGRGAALIDGEEVHIGEGDFIGFPTPSVPHLILNPFEADLVYLVVGERRTTEIADFPRLGKVLIREGLRVCVVSEAEFHDVREAWTARQRRKSSESTESAVRPWRGSILPVSKDGRCPPQCGRCTGRPKKE